MKQITGTKYFSKLPTNLKVLMRKIFVLKNCLKITNFLRFNEENIIYFLIAYRSLVQHISPFCRKISFYLRRQPCLKILTQRSPLFCRRYWNRNACIRGQNWTHSKLLFSKVRMCTGNIYSLYKITLQRIGIRIGIKQKSGSGSASVTK
jgi:hypothetical protein